MPGKPALIRQSDVTRIVKGYAAAGITAGIVVKDGEVRILPIDEIKSAEPPSSLEEWRRKRSAGEIDGAA